MPDAKTSLDKELQKANEQLYERNVELAIRNRTLSTLRKFYEIINTSLGIDETAQRLTDSIIQELQFQAGCIALMNRTDNTLKVIAISLSYSPGANSQNALKTILADITVSLDDKENLSVASVLHRQIRMTNMLYDITVPFIDEATAQKIQEIAGIQTSMIYPVIFAGMPLGVLILGMDKHVGLLSRAEQETMKELIEVVGIALERAQIYADLKIANERLKELDVLKDEFVSVASHELRTPMTAIKSYLWLALYGQESLSEKLRLYLNRSYNSVNRLIKLVNDMLNVSRIESGRITLDFKKVPIDVVVKEVIGEIEPRATELGISLTLSEYPPLPEAIADDDKIKEVLINLIGNSLKFTPKGGAITLSFAVKDAMVGISVKDTGEGIDEHDTPKLFRKFGFVKGSYATNQKASQGTGLGLYISKSIIELHGGTISVFSEGKGTGATFTFFLKTFNEKDFVQMQENQKGKEGLGIIHSGL